MAEVVLTRLDLEQEEDLQRHMEALAWGLIPDHTEPDARYVGDKAATDRFVYYDAYQLAHVPAEEEW